MIRINFLLYMLVCLILTIAIELFVALILKVKDKIDIINIVLVNILTNPLVVSVVNLISSNYGKKLSYIVLIFLEISAVLVEGYLYKKYLKYDRINPYLLSLILNVCSYLFGLLIPLFL